MEKSLISEIQRYREIMGMKPLITEQRTAKVRAVDEIIDRLFGRSLDDAEKAAAKLEANAALSAQLERQLDDLDAALTAGTKTASEFEDDLAEIVNSRGMADVVTGIIERQLPDVFEKLAIGAVEDFIGSTGLVGGTKKLDQIMGLSKDLPTAKMNVKKYMSGLGFDGQMNEKMVERWVTKNYNPDIFAANKSRVAGKVANIMADFEKIENSIASEIAKDAKMGAALKKVKVGLSKFTDDEIKLMEGAVKNNFENMKLFVAENTPKWYQEAIGLNSKYPTTRNVLLGVLAAGTFIGWDTLGFVVGKGSQTIPNSKDLKDFTDGYKKSKDTTGTQNNQNQQPPLPKKRGKYD